MYLRRNVNLYGNLRDFLNSMIGSVYELEFSGGENVPRDGPALLLPKHVCKMDTILEGLFLINECGRQGNWVMKYSGTPWFLEYLGGIKIVRPEDIKRRWTRWGKKRLIDRRKEINKNSMQYIKWLYLNGEVLVVNPEGTRTPGRVGRLRTGIINLSREVAKECHLDIPVVPIGIEYHGEPIISFSKPKAFVRAGKPLRIDEPGLLGIVENELRRLSGL